MKVTWYVDDGYVGNRPKHTEIDDDELLEYEEGPERDQYISDCIQDDFEQRVTWYRK